MACSSLKTEKVPVDVTSSTPVTLIVFDLETTGLKRTCDIVQVSAVDNKRCFDQYILPEEPISKGASDATKLTMVDGKLHYKGKPVNTVSKQEGMQNFIKFLKEFKEPVLVAHNCKNFDSKVLVNFLISLNLLDEFKDVCSHFLDTLLLFKAEVPNRKSYKQVDLVHDLLGEEYEAHNSLEDVKALQKLINLYPQETLMKYSFSVQSVKDKIRGAEAQDLLEKLKIDDS